MFHLLVGRCLLSTVFILPLLKCLRLTQSTQNAGLEGKFFPSSKSQHVKQIVVQWREKSRLQYMLELFCLSNTKEEIMTKFT